MDEHFKSVRPPWPYFRWIYKHAEDGDLKKDVRKNHITLKSDGNEPINGLQIFLQTFDKDLGIYDTDIGQAVQKEINKIMESAVNNLEKNNPLFKSCRCLKTGSVADGTKIREMNEFDFLIVLDILQVAYLEKIPFGGTKTWFKVKKEAKDFMRNSQDYVYLFRHQDGTPICLNGEHTKYDKGGSLEDDGLDNDHDNEFILEIDESVNLDRRSGDRREVAVRGLTNKIKIVEGRALNLGNNGHFDTSGNHKKTNSDNLILQNIYFRWFLTDLFLQEILGFINKYNGWKVVNLEDLKKRSNCSSDLAITLHLTSDIYNVEVDIDICFCVQSVESDIDNFSDPSVERYIDDLYNLILDRDTENMNISSSGPEVTGESDISKKLTIEATKRYLDHMKTVMLSDPDLEVFAIIGNGIGAEIPPWDIKTRITIPGLEVSPFQKCGIQSGQVTTYRYAKCVAEYFFPKVFNRQCPRCSHCLVKSYHLRTIVLYMMDNHTDSSLWNEDNIPNRVIEVFDILAKCIQFTEDCALRIQNVATIAAFSKPEYLELQRFYNYSPSYSFRDGKHTKQILYTGGPYSVVEYKTKFYPEYNATQNTGSIFVDNVIKSHFESFQNEHWTSTSLFLKVRDLLYKLRETKMM